MTKGLKFTSRGTDYEDTKKQPPWRAVAQNTSYNTSRCHFTTDDGERTREKVMRTITHDNETYWQVTEASAIRHGANGKVKVLTVQKDGSVMCITRKIQPSIYKVVEENLRGKR